MFDIGFWELITITLIVLIMVRPENLPKFAKDAGKFLARLRNFISNAKPVEHTCPECNGLMVESTRDRIVCYDKDCAITLNSNELTTNLNNTT